MHTDSVLPITWNITSASENCDLTFYFDTTTALPGLLIDSLFFSHYHDNKWNFLTNQSGASQYSGTVYKFSATTDGFSGFGGGSKGPGDEPGPLPVELITFDVRSIEDNRAILSWSTSSEVNSDYFLIEKSTNGIHFKQIDCFQIDPVHTVNITVH